MINVTAGQKGAKGVEEFRYIYCSIYQKKELPSLTTKFQAKLQDNPDIENIMDNWDSIKILISYLDLFGCILSKDPSVNAALNGRRYILWPTEHSKNWHPSSDTKKNKTTTIEKLFICKNNDVTNQCTLASNSNNQLIKVIPHLSSANSNETITTVKQNKKLKMRNIGQLLDPKLSIFDKESDDLDDWAKDFCIKTVITGANKIVSNIARISLWYCLCYHNTILRSVEINSQTVATPP